MKTLPGSSHRTVLGNEYHCLAEDLGRDDRGLVAQRGDELCKLVEYASCDTLGESGIRWKPWMSPRLLDSHRVCKYHALPMFWSVHQRWMELYVASDHADQRDQAVEHHQ